MQNCENFMGVVQIFMGLVGFLEVCGEEVDGFFFVLLVMIEGVLIVSINWGCCVIVKSGGVVVCVEDVGMMCVFVFCMCGIEEMQCFFVWVSENEDEICEFVE